MSFTRDWSDSIPVDHTLIPNVPSAIRAIRVDLEDRLGGFISGFVAGDTAVGMLVCPFIAQSTPTPVTAQIQAYGKAVTGKTEFHLQDADGHEIQVTSGGKIKASVIDINALYLLLHPVGDIVINITGTNPGSTFGGTWVAWGSGQVPVGVDTGQTEFATVEKTGGEKTHLLTSAESGLPAHTHTITNYNGPSNNAVVTAGNSSQPMGNSSTTNSNSSADAASAHNNLQPYITCYLWKRTV